jgi:hypothetical protein
MQIRIEGSNWKQINFNKRERVKLKKSKLKGWILKHQQQID